jgi:AraC family ethanolamine operon transcriptional activator
MRQDLLANGPEPLQPPATEPTWQHLAVSDDVDVHATSQPQWSLSYDQLSGGSFNGRIHMVQLPGLRLVNESLSCATRQRGQIGVGHYGFAMPARLEGPAIFNGQMLSPQSIMIGRSEDLDLCSPANFVLFGIVVDSELLTSLWARMYQLPLSRWLEHQIVVQARAAVADDLRTLHARALASIASHPGLLDDEASVLQLRDEILMEWIEAIPERIGSSELKSIASRKKLVDRACETVLAQQDAPLSMLELCSRLGTSQRKLEYCFKSVLGMSPARYLRVARLNGVRRELKRGNSAGLGVQDIATRWGFWQLGEFAADYRRQFGELPSATLNAARL